MLKTIGGATKRTARTIGMAIAAASSLLSAKLARRLAALRLAALVDDAAVAALALLKGEDRLEEMALAEVGPERGGDPDLAVRDLPEQEVGDSHLPARADQQVRVRESRCA